MDWWNRDGESVGWHHFEAGRWESHESRTGKVRAACK